MLATPWIGIGSARLRAPARPAAPGRLAYFDNLRALAILMVIATHCFPAAGALVGHSFNEHHPLVSLIGGATAIFVFIAGFFYERVYRPRLGWWALIARRAGLLLPPYLFISLVLVASGLEPGVRGMEPVTADPLAKLGLWLLTGTAGPATWFVPFFLLLLLFTPLFARFALAGVRVQLALLAALLLLAFVVPRDPLMVLANVAHFAF